MKYHPPITTYTDDDERRIRNAIAIAVNDERKLRRKLITAELHLEAAKAKEKPRDLRGFVTAKEIKERYPTYTTTWLIDHDIPRVCVEGVTRYPLKAVEIKHNALAGIYMHSELRTVCGVGDWHLRFLAKIGAITTVKKGNISLYDRDEVIAAASRYSYTMARDIARLKDKVTL